MAQVKDKSNMAQTQPNLLICMPTDTPSSSNWDEDDVTPPKKSSWDLPTPRTESGYGDSVRSDRSSWYKSDRSR